MPWYGLTRYDVTTAILWGGFRLAAGRNVPKLDAPHIVLGFNALAAEDAIEIDTTNLTPDQTLQKLIEVAAQKLN